ncbi:fungal-specific transcription factor domain-containing protein [Ilyonectria destructans]|nr:fungal-specific transcription factor domain-containing protein [Ilyonectria destructans]
MPKPPQPAPASKPTASPNSASSRGSGASTSPSSARSVKNRTGCEQCKRRRVKCDEKRPTCARCEARGETCTGNFQCDQWQIERPWIVGLSAAASGLENDSLRYWYDSACFTMAMFPPPVNPLSYPLASLLRRSKALRHVVQCVAVAHRHDFAVTSLSHALQERNLAIVSLQGEVARIQDSRNQQTLLRTVILSSLILCVSSGWLDPTGKEFGIEFLFGVKSIIHLLTDTAPTDPFAFYVMGLFLYLEAFSSYLVPTALQRQPSDRIVTALSQPPFNTLVHPVTGIATTLCPIVTDIGHYYRRVVETKQPCVERDRELRRRLWEWQPPEGSSQLAQLVQLAEGYRTIGDIMLYQARGVVAKLDAIDSRMLLERVSTVMETIRHIPKQDALLNWVGPLLIIAGSELPADRYDDRRLVEISSSRLVSFTKVPTYARSLELIKQVWELHDNGVLMTWLELMVESGLSLAVG